MQPPSTKVERRPASIKDMVAAPEYRNRLNDILGARAPQFAAALVQVVNRSFSLKKCTPESVMGAAITAAALDLSFDPNLGEAHLVPYGDACQFQIGYKGLTQLAMRSGQYKRLGWKVIYEGELRAWNELSGELVIDSTKKSGPEVIGYAAQFTLVNGFERGSYWSLAEVREHAARYSQAFKKEKKDSPWFTDFDKMALKTVLKELLNTWGPKSIQMQKAIGDDHGVRTSVDPNSEATFLDSADDTKKPREEDPPAEQQSPQSALAAACAAEGISFDMFRDWAIKTGNGDDSIGTWAEIKSVDAARHLRGFPTTKEAMKG